MIYILLNFVYFFLFFRMNSIVDDVNTMSVAAESHTYLLKNRSPLSDNHSGTPSRLVASPSGEFQMENISRGVRDIEKTVCKL